MKYEDQFVATRKYKRSLTADTTLKATDVSLTTSQYKDLYKNVLYASIKNVLQYTEQITTKKPPPICPEVYRYFMCQYENNIRLYIHGNNVLLWFVL